MSTMHAIRIHEFGGPEVLRYESIPCPSPGPGEVLVRVHAVSVNPVDSVVRSGKVRALLNIVLPVIPGADFAGVVAACGTGVTEFAKGDAVFGMLGLMGAYSEFVVAPVAAVALKPATLDFIHAASVPLAALTAWQALFDSAPIEAGQRVLIHAAAGGVGSFAVQLARWKGAQVIATASAANHQYLRLLGATQTLDYQQQRFEDGLSDIDVVLDLVGGDTAARSMAVLRPNGRLVRVANGAAVPQAEGDSRRVLSMMVKPSGLQLTAIAELIAAGDIRTEVAAVLPLERAVEAHQLSQGRHTRGKIVLQLA